MPPLLQPPDQVERLVGGDAAADDQEDARPDPVALTGAQERAGRGFSRRCDGGGARRRSLPCDQRLARMTRISSSTERPLRGGAQPQLGLDGVVELSDGQAGHGRLPQVCSNASIQCVHAINAISDGRPTGCREGAAMTQSATVRQRLLAASARPIAAIVSGDSVMPVAGHRLQLLQHRDRRARRSPARSRSTRPSSPAPAAASSMRPDGAEIALDPFAHHRLGDLPHVELRDRGRAPRPRPPPWSSAAGPARAASACRRGR